MHELQTLNRENSIYPINPVLMLYKSSWRFSLGLILLAIIYHNVKSNEQNEVSSVRRNIIKDIQTFFNRIFNPHKYSYKGPASKNNTKNKKPIKITIKKIPKTKSVYYVLRRIPKMYMINNSKELRNDLTDHKQRKPANSEIDITTKNSLRSMYFFINWFSKLFNISLRAYKDKENKYTIPDGGEEHNYVNNRRKNGDDLKTLIIVVNTKKGHEEIMAREGLPYLDFKSFTKYDMKRTILRQAYGIACIKLAIRKCYKALRRVNDIVCNRLFKCKSSFKSTFLLKAKRSCIRGFDYTGLYNQKSRKKKNKYIYRTLAVNKREKYIDACIPYILQENTNTVRKNINWGNSLPQIAKQILRDESDRKCQKFSREVCLKACNSARDEVCSIFTCGKRKKKAFTKECKNECRRSYVIKSDSSDSSKSSGSE